MRRQLHLGHLTLHFLGCAGSLIVKKVLQEDFALMFN